MVHKDIADVIIGIADIPHMSYLIGVYFRRPGISPYITMEDMNDLFVAYTSIGLFLIEACQCIPLP